jgi:hypothetical protein
MAASFRVVSNSAFRIVPPFDLASYNNLHVKKLKIKHGNKLHHVPQFMDTISTPPKPM